MSRWPLSARIMGTLGALCLCAGLALLAGLGTTLHPLLDNAGAGLAILVSGISLIGSAAFPVVIARLMARDENAAPGDQ